MEKRYLDLVKNKSFETALTSLQVAEITGKLHKNVLADIEDESSKLGTEIAGLIFQPSTYRDKNNQSRKCFDLTKDGVMQIGARYDATTRFKMIQRINELENEIKKDSYMIQDPVERAKAWIIEEEERKRLNIENVKLENKVSILTHTNKLYTTTEVAKEIGFKSAMELNKKLSELKVQYKVNNTWVLTSKYSNLGYESIKQTILENEKVIYDRKWTLEGREFILNTFNKKMIK